MSPCSDYCTPADDKEILFIRGTYPSTDPRLTWDYLQQPPLLSVGGKIAASGSIASSSEVDGSFFSPQALGTGSFNFTPASGYGGLLYRGGSMFYYWNDLLNSWQPLDFASHVSNATQIIAGPGLLGGGPLTSDVTLQVDPNYAFVDLYHNGVFASSRPIINFLDSVSVSWGISSNGDATVTAFGTGGGAWIADVNANNHSIINLNSINGVPIGLFCTNPFNRDVVGNNYSMNQINNITTNGNVTVGGTLYYHGVPIDSLISSGGLWTQNPDGSIYRSSNVTINGTTAPLTVTSSLATNYLYLDTLGAAGFNAYAVQFQGVYSGELGWSPTVVELWTKGSLMFRGYDASGAIYFPGNAGFGTTTPAQKIDVVGNVNTTGCYLISGVAMGCNDGAGGINLFGTRITAGISVVSPTYYIGNVLMAASDGGSGINLTNITSINGSTSAIAQTPWRSNIDGNNFALLNVGSIGVGTGGLGSSGNINTNSCYYVSNVVFACGNGAGQVNLSNIATINGNPPAGGSGSVYIANSGTQMPLTTSWQPIPGCAIQVPRAGIFLVMGSFYSFFTASTIITGTIAINAVLSTQTGETTNPFNQQFYGGFTMFWTIRLNANDVVGLWAHESSAVSGSLILNQTQIVAQWISA